MNENKKGTLLKPKGNILYQKYHLEIYTTLGHLILCVCKAVG